MFVLDSRLHPIKGQEYTVDISEYGVSPNADTIVRDLVKYDLLKHAVELQAYGMTVVPKEKMGVDDDFVERLRGAILRACEKRNGVAINDHTADEPDPKQISKNSWYLLQEDEAFVEAATNPRALASETRLASRPQTTSPAAT